MRENMKSPSPDSSSDEDEPGCAGAQRASPASTCTFLNKLWEIISSPHFQSVWWGDNGNCVVIAGDLFQEEVLGPHEIFENDSMADFVHQLSLHGFCRMEGDSRISIPVEELRAIVAAGSSLGKLYYFYSPFFERECPELLRMCRQSPGERERTPAAAPRSPKQGGKRKRKQRVYPPEVEEGVEEEENNLRCHAEPSRTATQPCTDPDAPSTSAGPTPAKRCRIHSPDGIQEAAQAPSEASLQRCTPPTSPDMETPPGPSWWPSSAPRLHGRKRPLQLWAEDCERDGLSAPRAAPVPCPATAQVAAGVEEEEKDLQNHTAASLPANEPWADPDAPSTSDGPPPAKRCRTHSPDGVQDAAPAPPSPPPQRRSPPSPPFLGPPLYLDWWLSPDAVLPPWHGLLPFRPPEPEPVEPPAPCASPPPRPPQYPRRRFRHCPTCYCPPDPWAAGQGDGR